MLYICKSLSVRYERGPLNLLTQKLPDYCLQLDQVCYVLIQQYDQPHSQSTVTQSILGNSGKTGAPPNKVHYQGKAQTCLYVSEAIAFHCFVCYIILEKQSLQFPQRKNSTYRNLSR